MQTKLSISKILGATSLLALVSASPALADTAPVENGASQISITLTGDNGGTCVLDHDSAAAGPVSFQVTNKSATSISEVELLSGNRILGEKENLAPGLPTVGFTVTLGGGDYQIYCPGAGKDKLAFTVTGEAKKASGDISDLLKDGTKGYAHYVDGMVESMVTAVGRLKGDIDAGDLKAAKAEYPVARSFYERIESDVEGFVLPGHDVTDNSGNLDYLIDMRASNLDPAVGWHGFHAIERDLYENGKITGEEEAYSHTDLVDFAANIEGAEQAFAFLEPGMKKIDPDLTKQVEDEFAKVDADLATYRDENEPGGYKLYTAELKASDAEKLSKQIQALQEPLSRIAEKVATAR